MINMLENNLRKQTIWWDINAHFSKKNENTKRTLGMFKVTLDEKSEENIILISGR
jgi:hypothetical protein